MATDQLPALPEATLEGHPYELWGQNVVGDFYVRGLVEKIQRDAFDAGKRAAIAADRARAVPVAIEPLLTAIRFYARGEHYHIDPEQDESFDTVSGEPPNWLFSERNDDTTMFENGEVARRALRGQPTSWIDGDEDHTPQPIDGEAWNTRPPAPEQPADSFVLQLLVAAGHVSQAKVDEAKAIEAKTWFADLSGQAATEAGEREAIARIASRVEAWLGTNCAGKAPSLLIAALVAVARASLSTPASGEGWMPIIDAPVEQMVLVAAEFDRPGDWRIKVGYLSKLGQWVVFGASWDPTRWMPLPPAPTSPTEPAASSHANPSVATAGPGDQSHANPASAEPAAEGGAA